MFVVYCKCYIRSCVCVYKGIELFMYRDGMAKGCI